MQCQIDSRWNDVTLTRIKIQSVFRGKCEMHHTHSTLREHLKCDMQILQQFLFYLNDTFIIHSSRELIWFPSKPSNPIRVHHQSTSKKNIIICQSHTGRAYPLFWYTASSAIRSSGNGCKCVECAGSVFCGLPPRVEQRSTRAWLNDFIYTNSVNGMTFPLNMRPFRTIHYYYHCCWE